MTDRGARVPLGEAIALTMLQLPADGARSPPPSAASSLTYNLLGDPATPAVGGTGADHGDRERPAGDERRAGAAGERRGRAAASRPTWSRTSAIDTIRCSRARRRRHHAELDPSLYTLTPAFPDTPPRAAAGGATTSRTRPRSRPGWMTLHHPADRPLRRDRLRSTSSSSSRPSCSRAACRSRPTTSSPPTRRSPCSCSRRARSIPTACGSRWTARRSPSPGRWRAATRPGGSTCCAGSTTPYAERGAHRPPRGPGGLVARRAPFRVENALRARATRWPSRTPSTTSGHALRLHADRRRARPTCWCGCTP